MPELSGFRCEWKFISLFRQFICIDWKRQLRDGCREGGVDKHFQNIPCAGGDADIKALSEVEFGQRMQADNVVQMKMAEEKVDGFRIPFIYIPVQFVEAASGIEDNLIIIRSYEDTDSVPGVGIIPAVRAQEDHSHVCRTKLSGTKDYLSCSFEKIRPKTRVTGNNLV